MGLKHYAVIPAESSRVRAADPPQTYLRPGMGRKIDVDDLVGSAEIARRLGVRRRQVVNGWRQRHADFPAPAASLEMGNVWAWPEVEAWARKTGRLHG